MNKADLYDIVVIGAGPAGSTFARLVSDGTKKILLINGQNEKNKKPCGGLLAPDAQKALAHLGLVLPSCILVDPQIFSVKTIDLCSGLVRYYPRHYLNIDRYAFDKWLVSLVPQEVEKAYGRCLKIVRKDGCFELDVSIDGVVKTVFSKNVVGADGANSLVRRTFYNNNIKKYIAIQQWFDESENENPFYSCIFDEKTSESCSWSIFKGGKFIFGGCFTVKDGKKQFNEQKKRLEQKENFIFSKNIKTEACLTLRPKKPTDFITGKNGVYLIGEAAGFISPSSFEGISSALITGYKLARAFDRAECAVGKTYKFSTLNLRVKLCLKMLKRWFMYTPFVRRLILKSGICSIKLWQKDTYKEPLPSLTKVVSSYDPSAY